MRCRSLRAGLTAQEVHFGDFPLETPGNIGHPGGQVKRQCAVSATCRQMPSFAVTRPMGLQSGHLSRYNRDRSGERDGRTLPGTSPSERPSEDRLDSWKEIAAYLSRDVTTVQRWEKREGMPVHRHVHDKRGSVYAVGSELDAWLQSRRAAFGRGRRESQKPEAPVEAEGEHRQRAILPARGWLALAGVVVLGLLAVAYFTSRGRTGNAAQPKIKSLAVLPLKNLSGDPTQEYLADGMTEALIGRLSAIHDLRVISRTSVMRFKNPQLSVPEIARMLGRGCHCRRVGNARGQSDSRHGPVDSRRDRRALLVGNLRSRAAGCAYLQSELAQSIAEKVEVTVTGEEHERLAAARPSRLKSTRAI